MSLHKIIFRAQHDALADQGAEIDRQGKSIRELRTSLVASRDACAEWRRRAESAEARVAELEAQQGGFAPIAVALGLDQFSTGDDVYRRISELRDIELNADGREDEREALKCELALLRGQEP